jgi:hypothetical protein
VIAGVLPRFPATAPLQVEVVERLAGNASTEFGAPGVPPTVDSTSVGFSDLVRLQAIMRACWTDFDRAAAAVEGVVLATGPRGGGRDLATIRRHVAEADGSYLAASAGRRDSRSAMPHGTPSITPGRSRIGRRNRRTRSRLEEAEQEGSGAVGEADDLVRRLTVELEVELSLGAGVVPISEGLEFASSEPASCVAGAVDRDADPWRVSPDVGHSRGRFSRGDDSPRDQAVAASFSLAKTKI